MYDIDRERLENNTHIPLWADSNSVSVCTRCSRYCCCCYCDWCSGWLSENWGLGNYDCCAGVARFRPSGYPLGRQDCANGCNHLKIKIHVFQEFFRSKVLWDLWELIFRESRHCESNVGGSYRRDWLVPAPPISAASFLRFTRLYHSLCVRYSEILTESETKTAIDR